MDPITVLTPEQSLQRLQQEQLGRIVVHRKDDWDIFPVNYVCDGKDIYFRSAEGDKLFSLNLNHDVMFQVDHVEEDSAWSVVGKGSAEIIKDAKEVLELDQLDLKPWIPTLKYNYVRITPSDVSGRAFVLGEEPERF